MHYLTKSRFKIAIECPTKLYYNDNKVFANYALENTFLQELATGGFQVGALAKCYYPGGVQIETKDHEAAFAQTLKLLKLNEIIIYEAAFLYENCFIRADILIKKGNEIDLIEVKAKSYARSKDKFFKKNEEGINSKWEPYLYDIAFQTWVTNHSLQSAGIEHLHITPFLLLADKETNATVEGLNQRFFVDPDTRKVQLDPELCTLEKLGEQVLIKVNLAEEVNFLSQQNILGQPFIDFINESSVSVANNEIIWSEIGTKCKKCNFIADEGAVADGKLNGFHQCWKQQVGFTDMDFKKSMSWEIWDNRRSNNWLAEGKYFMSQLTLDDLGQSNSNGFGLSRIERQDIQRIKTFEQDYQPYLDKKTLQQYFAEWQYPLHCIDFETTTVALPFHKDMHPYEQIAFQFSHHIIQEDGSVKHETEWLNFNQGNFPNFDFVRALKKALGTGGTIFRYAAHENSVLCQIHEQLKKSGERDKVELMNFIEWITKKKTKEKSKEIILWEGDRNMVDLLEVVKSCYYSLYAKGSNSIKAILPAILNSSSYLQKKYSQPIYGTEKMSSKNYHDFTWIKMENGLVQNPYKLLEPVFSREEDMKLDDLLMDDDSEVNDGGAAMAAYGKMQFTHMKDDERKKISNALLRYCELDTLGMVMILEEFGELIK